MTIGSPRRKRDIAGWRSLRGSNRTMWNMGPATPSVTMKVGSSNWTSGISGLINAYFPSGTSGEERQSYKYQWLDEFFEYLEGLKKKIPRLIVCGDYNIAHNAIDIHDPKGNKNNSGFLPEERAWMDKLMSSGWVDGFRQLNPDPHQYSWWRQRFPSVRQENKGWRIDYISVTDPLKGNMVKAAIYPDVKQSDHCPVYLGVPTRHQTNRVPIPRPTNRVPVPRPTRNRG